MSLPLLYLRVAKESILGQTVKRKSFILLINEKRLLMHPSWPPCSAASKRAASEMMTIQAYGSKDKSQALERPVIWVVFDAKWSEGTIQMKCLDYNHQGCCEERERTPRCLEFESVNHLAGPRGAVFNSGCLQHPPSMIHIHNIALSFFPLWHKE